MNINEYLNIQKTGVKVKCLCGNVIFIIGEVARALYGDTLEVILSGDPIIKTDTILCNCGEILIRKSNDNFEISEFLAKYLENYNLTAKTSISIFSNKITKENIIPFMVFEFADIERE